MTTKKSDTKKKVARAASLSTPVTKEVPASLSQKKRANALVSSLGADTEPGVSQAVSPRVELDKAQVVKSEVKASSSFKSSVQAQDVAQIETKDRAQIGAKTVAQPEIKVDAVNKDASASVAQAQAQTQAKTSKHAIGDAQAKNSKQVLGDAIEDATVSAAKNKTKVANAKSKGANTKAKTASAKAKATATPDHVALVQASTDVPAATTIATTIDAPKTSPKESPTESSKSSPEASSKANGAGQARTKASARTSASTSTAATKSKSKTKAKSATTANSASMAKSETQVKSASRGKSATAAKRSTTSKGTKSSAQAQEKASVAKPSFTLIEHKDGYHPSAARSVRQERREEDYVNNMVSNLASLFTGGSLWQQKRKRAKTNKLSMGAFTLSSSELQALMPRLYSIFVQPSEALSFGKIAETCSVFAQETGIELEELQCRDYLLAYSKEVEQKRKQPLDEHYPIIFIENISLPAEMIFAEHIFIFVGCTDAGNLELLDVRKMSRSSKWTDFVALLKSRGCKRIDLASVPFTAMAADSQQNFSLGGHGTILVPSLSEIANNSNVHEDITDWVDHVFDIMDAPNLGTGIEANKNSLLSVLPLYKEMLLKWSKSKLFVSDTETVLRYNMRLLMSISFACGWLVRDALTLSAYLGSYNDLANFLVASVLGTTNIEDETIVMMAMEYYILPDLCKKFLDISDTKAGACRKDV